MSHGYRPHNSDSKRWNDCLKSDRCESVYTYIPMVAMHKLEWTRKNVEQLASTRAISAAINAFPNTDSPGHPYPYHKQLSLFN